MMVATVDQVRASSVDDLATSLLALSDAQVLGLDAESAEAMVAAAQRVISAVTAVQVVAIEAWERREGEQLVLDKVRWQVAAGGHVAAGGGVGGVPRDEHDFMPSYLAPVLRLSPRSARRRYETARVLAGSLPVTLAAMRAGDLEPHRAQHVVDEVPAGDLGVCAAVEAVLFPKIVDKPTTRVGVLARKAVAAADPGAAAQLAVAAQAGRFVSAGPSGLPGLMRLEAELDAGRGRLVWAAVEELAADYLRDEVAATVGQARADALVDLVLSNVSITTVVDLALPAGFASAGSTSAGSCKSCGAGPSSDAGENSEAGESSAPGTGAGGVGDVGGSVLEDLATGVLVDADQGRDLQTRIDAETATKRDARRYDERKVRLAGRRSGHQSGHDSAHDSGHDPGRGTVLRLLSGLPTAGVLDHRVGSLTSATIEAILADPDTVFRRLVVDPESGWVTDAGATTYQPGRHLARTVRKRDLYCRFPGCATTAQFCDLDHVIPFPVGLTVLANLACLCRRHHRLKTHGHWSLRMTPDGVCTWSDRLTGQVHITEPADYRDLAV